VFAGSSFGSRPVYAQAAASLGTELAARGCTLVYGGGRVGLMGVLADAALAAGGRVIGVIPEALARREVAHSGLSELLVTATMHERKARMAERSDSVVALPGGLGTLEELFEILTWNQLGFCAKPFGLVNAAGYFDRLLAHLDHAVAERFLHPAHRAMLVCGDSAPRLLDALEAVETPVVVEKWFDRT
jgi:uncharacterized protein (TIGR00730 family)